MLKAFLKALNISEYGAEEHISAQKGQGNGGVEKRT